MELCGGGGGGIEQERGDGGAETEAEKWRRGWRSDQGEEGLEQRGLSEESWSRGLSYGLEHGLELGLEQGWSKGFSERFWTRGLNMDCRRG